ncbi:hypothetical protein Tco_1300808 [Tanacetum coccineum]
MMELLSKNQVMEVNQAEELEKICEELQTKDSKRLKEDKDDEAKDDEPTKKLTKRRKQIARKGMHTSMDENVSDDSDKVDEQEETKHRYGMDGPEDKLEKGFWKCLRIMFEEPLSTDSIWKNIPSVDEKPGPLKAPKTSSKDVKKVPKGTKPGAKSGRRKKKIPFTYHHP